MKLGGFYMQIICSANVLLPNFSSFMSHYMATIFFIWFCHLGNPNYFRSFSKPIKNGYNERFSTFFSMLRGYPEEGNSKSHGKSTFSTGRILQLGCNPALDKNIQWLKTLLGWGYLNKSQWIGLLNFDEWVQHIILSQIEAHYGLAWYLNQIIRK